MPGGQRTDERAAEEVTVTLPSEKRAQPVATATIEGVEPWEEHTQIDQPWTPDFGESLDLSRLALPPIFDQEDEDDNELTDYALTIEPSTPPSSADAGVATTLMPRRPLPAALAFRPNIGTTPPPRRVPKDPPAISWRSPGDAPVGEETAPTIELERRPQPRSFEKRCVTLRGPAPMPTPRPQTAVPPLPLSSYACLPEQGPPVAPSPVGPSRMTVLAFVMAGILFGALVGVLAALYFGAS
jgi:hypothetical protein